MKRPRKYGPGEPFGSVHEFMDYANRNCRDPEGIVWLGMPGSEYGKAQHVAWSMNQSFARVYRLVCEHALRHAEVTDEYREWLKQESENVSEG